MAASPQVSQRFPYAFIIGTPLFQTHHTQTITWRARRPSHLLPKRPSCVRPDCFRKATISMVHQNQQQQDSASATDGATDSSDTFFGDSSRASRTSSETKSAPEQSLVERFRFIPFKIPERFRVVLLCFISFVICNCDRINISVAILPMAKYYGWSQTTVGIIQSAFFWGYVLTQIPGGYVADRFGGKHVLAMGVIVWSAMTVVTPAAASTSIPILLMARALLGVGEGVAMPAMNNIISKWVPQQERARSLSLTYSGMYLGSVVGLWLCPTLIVAFGWQSVFHIFGALGFVWWLFWQTGSTSTPQQSSSISKTELDFILKDAKSSDAPNSSSAPADKVPWGKLLSEPATWAIIVAHFCTTWGYFVLLTWLPTYFNQQLGFDLAASSFLSIVPWLAMFVSANIGGTIADTLLARGTSVSHVRKIMQTVGMLGPAVFLGLVSITSTPSLAVTYMTCALALGSFCQSGVYSNHQDIGPQYAGILLGISNTAAAVAGIVGVALTGFMLDLTSSWTLVFAVAIGFYCVGMLTFNIFARGDRIF